jgi:hypothetical protein
VEINVRAASQLHPERTASQHRSDQRGARRDDGPGIHVPILRASCRAIAALTALAAESLDRLSAVLRLPFRFGFDPEEQ